MPVRKKAEKTVVSQDKIDEIINKGGSVSVDKKEKKAGNQNILLNIPIDMLEKIDAIRKKNVGKISRNQWIVQALADALKSYD